MKPNQVLHKELHVKPLDEGQTATFRLIGANKLGNKYSSGGRRLPINPAVKQVPGMAYLYDPHKKTRVRIGNVVGEEPNEENGKTVFKQITAAILIENGEIIFNAEQNDSYCFMMRHPGCKTNPWHDRKKKPIFELIDKAAERQSKIAYDAVEDDAIILLRDSGLDELLAIAESLHEDYKSLVNVDNSVDEIRHDLRNIVRKGNPEVIIRASDYKFGKMKLQVIESEKWLILKRIVANRAWHSIMGDQKKELMTVEPGTDMITALIHWFTQDDDGKAFYQKELLPRLKAYKANV